MARVSRVPSSRTAGRVLGALAVLSAVVVAGVLLPPNPLADAFFAGWVVAIVAVALVGGGAAWTARTPLLWVAALLLSALSVVGMWSVGLFVAPAAAFLLVAALLAPRSGPSPDARQALLADPPTAREFGLKSVAGLVAIAIGGWLVYGGAVDRELFGACASETLACAVAVTRWNAVGMTVLGLVAVGLGGWLVWRQAVVAWVLATDHVR